MVWEKGQSGNEGGRSKEGKIWSEAIKRAIKSRQSSDPLALEKLADKLLVACAQGDISAMKELGDRLDGKATNFVVVENRTAFDEMQLDELRNRDKAIAERIERLQALRLTGPSEEKTGSLPPIH